MIDAGDTTTPQPQRFSDTCFRGYPMIGAMYIFVFSKGLDPRWADLVYLTKSFTMADNIDSSTCVETNIEFTGNHGNVYREWVCLRNTMKDNPLLMVERFLLKSDPRVGLIRFMPTVTELTKTSPGMLPKNFLSVCNRIIEGFRSKKYELKEVINRVALMKVLSMMRKNGWSGTVSLARYKLGSTDVQDMSLTPNDVNNFAKRLKNDLADSFEKLTALQKKYFVLTHGEMKIEYHSSPPDVFRVAITDSFSPKEIDVINKLAGYNLPRSHTDTTFNVGNQYVTASQKPLQFTKTGTKVRERIQTTSGMISRSILENDYAWYFSCEAANKIVRYLLVTDGDPCIWNAFETVFRKYGSLSIVGYIHLFGAFETKLKKRAKKLTVVEQRKMWETYKQLKDECLEKLIPEGNLTKLEDEWVVAMTDFWEKYCPKYGPQFEKTWPNLKRTILVCAQFMTKYFKLQNNIAESSFASMKKHIAVLFCLNLTEVTNWLAEKIIDCRLELLWLRARMRVPFNVDPDILDKIAYENWREVKQQILNTPKKDVAQLLEIQRKASKHGKALIVRNIRPLQPKLPQELNRWTQLSVNLVGLKLKIHSVNEDIFKPTMFLLNSVSFSRTDGGLYAFVTGVLAMISRDLKVMFCTCDVWHAEFICPHVCVVAELEALWWLLEKLFLKLLKKFHNPLRLTITDVSGIVRPSGRKLHEPTGTSQRTHLDSAIKSVTPDQSKGITFNSPTNAVQKVGLSRVAKYSKDKIRERIAPQFDITVSASLRKHDMVEAVKNEAIRKYIEDHNVPVPKILPQQPRGGENTVRRQLPSRRRTKLFAPVEQQQGDVNERDETLGKRKCPWVNSNDDDVAIPNESLVPDKKRQKKE